jgi:hypothetical protein
VAQTHRNRFSFGGAVVPSKRRTTSPARSGMSQKVIYVVDEDNAGTESGTAHHEMIAESGLERIFHRPSRLHRLPMLLDRAIQAALPLPRDAAIPRQRLLHRQDARKGHGLKKSEGRKRPLPQITIRCAVSSRSAMTSGVALSPSRKSA